MSEHKKNPMAIMAAAAAGQPAGQVGVDLRLAYSPKQHIAIVPPDRIREREGRTEVFGSPTPDAEATWHVPPEGVRVVAAGDQLGLESMDVVVTLMAVSYANITSPSGQPVARFRVLKELFREDAQSFAAQLAVRPKEAS